MQFFLKVLFLISLLLLNFNFTSHASSAAEIEKYKQSWTAKALALQRQLDLNVPFSQATLLGTHNTENAKAYAIPLIRYLDPNQILSIYDQLEMGIRSLEFDVHWALGRHAKREILLCHALPNHVGCSVFDRVFREGLEEISRWLKANPNQLVVLYLDRYLSGHEQQAIQELDTYLGEFIYKPAQLAPVKTSSSPPCTSLPGTLTQANVLKARKQVIIVTKTCDSAQARSNYQSSDKSLAWNDFVFTGIGKTSRDPFAFLDATMNSFTAFPDCGFNKNFADDPDHAAIWRIFEDRSVLSSLVRPERKLLAKDMKDLLKCGINWPTMDMLVVNDERLTAAIWSWAPSYPREELGQCALYKKNVGIQNVACEKILSSAYACQHSKSKEWRIINAAGYWQGGEAQCQRAAGSAWHFAMPINGQQMYLLNEALQSSEVWLNYLVDKAGHWQANIL